MVGEHLAADAVVAHALEEGEIDEAVLREGVVVDQRPELCGRGVGGWVEVEVEVGFGGGGLESIHLR